MYKFISALLFIPFASIAQIPQPKEVKKCYERENSNARFANWECGKIAGIVDCNEKLTYDENTNTILSGNDGSAFSGTCETCFSNGVLERRITFLNGKEDGPDTTFYRSGCRQVLRNHIRGAENGQWLYYYDSTAQLSWEINYLVGEKHGKSIYFSPNGDTTLWENYNQGLLEGTKRTYFSESKIKSEVDYKAGLLHGKQKRYGYNGQLLEDISFLAGKKDGICKYYYNDGTLLKTENWMSGVKNGEFKTFYIQGHVQSTEFYKRGLKEGEFTDFYPDQSIKRRHIYKKDILVEDHQFNADGDETFTLGESIKGANKEDDAMPMKGEKVKKSRRK